MFEQQLYGRRSLNAFSTTEPTPFDLVAWQWRMCMLLNGFDTMSVVSCSPSAPLEKCGWYTRRTPHSAVYYYAAALWPMVSFPCIGNCWTATKVHVNNSSKNIKGFTEICVMAWLGYQFSFLCGKAVNVAWYVVSLLTTTTLWSIRDSTEEKKWWTRSSFQAHTCSIVVVVNQSKN